MQYLVVMLAMVALDYASAEYTRAVVAGQWAVAGALAALLVASGAYITVEVARNRWLVLAAGIGAFIGTALSVAGLAP